MNVKIGICSDDNRTVFKSVSWVADIDCSLKTPVDIMNPVLTVVGRPLETFASVNYVYIEKLKRYYYLSPAVMQAGGIIELHCHVDVLKSNADAISAITTVVERNEFIYNNYYVDEKLLTRCDRILDTQMIGSIPRGNGANIVLTVVNGGASE